MAKKTTGHKIAKNTTSILNIVPFHQRLTAINGINKSTHPTAYISNILEIQFIIFNSIDPPWSHSARDFRLIHHPIITTGNVGCIIQILLFERRLCMCHAAGILAFY